MSEEIKPTFEQAESVKPITEVSKDYTPEELAEIEAKRTISDAELLQTGAHYKINEETGEKKLVADKEQIKKINEAVEDLLAKRIITQEALNNGDIEIHIEEPAIGYEFEMENEQRLMIEMANFQVSEWKNHIIDTYDQSGRCRIRLKNGEPRLSLKVPLFSKDVGEKIKCCIRLEFKPRTEQQAEELLKIKELISAEPETKTHEKWGTPIKLNNGDKVYINRDDEGKAWIEIGGDRDIKELLPEGITYLGHKKSKINVRQEKSNQEHRSEDDPEFRNFQQNFAGNMETLSRSAKGISDTSVSKDKEKLDLEGEKLANQVQENIQGLAKYIWENKTRQFETTDDVRGLLNDIAGLANNKLSEKRTPNAFRTHEVPYGRKIPPAELEKEMEMFYNNLLEKMRGADTGSLDPKNLAKWAELEINKNIHPYADGCGKIAVGLSSFIFARYNHVLPNYDSRKTYYDAMNKGEEEFDAYYQEVFNNNKNKET